MSMMDPLWTLTLPSSPPGWAEGPRAFKSAEGGIRLILGRPQVRFRPLGESLGLLDEGLNHL